MTSSRLRRCPPDLGHKPGMQARIQPWPAPVGVMFSASRFQDHSISDGTITASIRNNLRPRPWTSKVDILASHCRVLIRKSDGRLAMHMRLHHQITQMWRTVLRCSRGRDIPLRTASITLLWTLLDRISAIIQRLGTLEIQQVLLVRLVLRQEVPCRRAW